MTIIVGAWSVCAVRQLFYAIVPKNQFKLDRSIGRKLSKRTRETNEEYPDAVYLPNLKKMEFAHPAHTWRRDVLI